VFPVGWLVVHVNITHKLALAVSLLFWFEGLDGGGPYHSSSESNQYVYFHEYSLVDASPP